MEAAGNRSLFSWKAAMKRRQDFNTAAFHHDKEANGPFSLCSESVFPINQRNGPAVHILDPNIVPALDGEDYLIDVFLFSLNLHNH